MSGRLPLLTHGAGDAVVRVGGRAVERDCFLGQAAALAERLPAADQVILLSDDRYRFLLLFCAAMLRGQSVLLPPNGSRGAVTHIGAEHPGAYVALDAFRDDLPLPQLTIEIPPPATCAEVPLIAASHIAAVPFTSGSCGPPRPHPKRWGELFAGAERTLGRLAPAAGATVVATVPAQHMFGLETSVVLPLVGALATSAERPFFPADLADTLGRLPAPRLLVTTPVHLRALAGEESRWPAVDFILSATAPMPATLAQRAERVFDAPVLEIFGSTETGAIATRRSIEGERWHTLSGVRLQEQGGRIEVHAEHLGAPVPLGDTLDLEDAGHFVFRGRHHDMVKIAGKRASLGDLNQRLLAVPGIEDGAFVQLEENGAGVARLAALVVAPDVEETAILRALGDQLDPVFMPRRLRRVAQLPRNATGKLPRAQLLALLAESGDEA